MRKSHGAPHTACADSPQHRAGGPLSVGRPRVLGAELHSLPRCGTVHTAGCSQPEGTSGWRRPTRQGPGAAAHVDPLLSEALTCFFFPDSAHLGAEKALGLWERVRNLCIAQGTQKSPRVQYASQYSAPAPEPKSLSPGKPHACPVSRHRLMPQQCIVI